MFVASHGMHHSDRQPWGTPTLSGAVLFQKLWKRNVLSHVAWQDGHFMAHLPSLLPNPFSQKQPQRGDAAFHRGCPSIPVSPSQLGISMVLSVPIPLPAPWRPWQDSGL